MADARTVGSLAAGLQSVVYGGATGGVFSVLQGIGARAAFPVAVNFIAGALGAGAAANATADAGADANQVASDGGDLVGDIGDDP